MNGFPITNFSPYRVVSPDFHFNAPTPWYYGPVGGAGTSVADGYYIMTKPLCHGRYTIHYGGAFHFAIAQGDPFDYDASIDMTYNVNVH